MGVTHILQVIRIRLRQGPQCYTAQTLKHGRNTLIQKDPFDGRLRTVTWGQQITADRPRLWMGISDTIPYYDQFQYKYTATYAKYMLLVYPPLLVYYMQQHTSTY